ncbi:MAG: DUF7168 domain-containing protein [Methyloligellaceae bacterium]
MSALRKIKALLRKTTSAGCSEAEAVTAAEVAARLMDENNISMSEVDAREEEYSENRQKFASGTVRPTWHPVSFVFESISKFCDCEYWMQGFDLIYFGSKSDVEIAHYLTSVLRRAMDIEYEKARVQARLSGSKINRRSFHMGMSYKLSQRLLEIKRSKDQQSKSPSSSAAIVSIKRERIQEEMISLGISPTERKNSRQTYDKLDLLRGSEAGENVQIVDGIKRDHGAMELLGREQAV